jgi:hypothetical protein
MNRFFNSPKFIYLLIGFAILLNFSGLFITIMGPDAARYAAIAKTMVLRNNYMDLLDEGVDWLDKPHFPFWVTALFFKWFGFTTWAYKLPGILFLMLGGWYTYLFGKNLYNKEVGLWAALILLTSEHIILSNNDVRAEPFLTGLIIAGIYHFYKAYTTKNTGQLVLACLFTACAVMTKGIFALIPIGGAIAGHIIIKKDWKNLFHIRWIIAFVLVGIFILPELYSLYYQFDMHPEKLVLGRTHVSGISFFFWDSQFGRFLNTGPIKGAGDPFFFFHTVLWAFLPWSLLLYVAFFSIIRKNIHNAKGQEWYCVCGSLLTFILFSASKFQLPHYLNIVFPLFAIITAQYIYYIKSETTLHRVKVTQMIMVFLLLCAPFLLQIFFKPEHISYSVVALLLLILSLLVFLFFSTTAYPKQKIIGITVLASLFLNFYANLDFYPSLMRYQSGSEAAFWINKNNVHKWPVAVEPSSFPFSFYLNQPAYIVDTSKQNVPAKPFLIFTSYSQANSLVQKGWNLHIVKSFEHFQVTQLTIPFINKKTRSETLQQVVVARVQ